MLHRIGVTQRHERSRGNARPGRSAWRATLHRLIDTDRAMQAPRCGQTIRSPMQRNVAQRHGATWAVCLTHENHERCDGPENHQHGQSAQVHIASRVNGAQQCKAGHGKALSVELAHSFFEVFANRHKRQSTTRSRRVAQHDRAMPVRLLSAEGDTNPILVALDGIGRGDFDHQKATYIAH
jgi:hypothetical protein